jgi:iron complex outermembrane receptor protein
MKSIIPVFSTLLISIAGMAQKASVKGNVVDNSAKPVHAATVSLLAAKDSSTQRTAVSDNEGTYRFENIKSGNYLVKVSSVNFETWYSNNFVLTEGASYSLQAASLVTAEKKLKDVVVTATKKPMIEVKADRTVFNVENSINATGSTAMELLQKSPGVTVDKDDNISMKGKNGVRIYIDGKPSPMAGTDLAAYLRSVQSADIESIEMIENPSAKYDASGNAGIINIKFKKNRKFGTNGSASAGFNQGIHSNYNSNLSVNYRNRKLNLFSNISANKGIWENWNNFYRLQSDSIYDQKAVNVNHNKNGNIKAGADYQINSKSTIGIMYNGNFSNWNWRADGQTIISAQSTKVPTQILKAGNQIPSTRNNQNINLNYRYADTSGHELNVDVDRGFFRHRGESMQPNYYYDANTNVVLRERIFANSTPVNIDIYTAKADYEQTLLKGKLGLGVKYASVKTDNTFDFFNIIDKKKQQDWERSNHFTYTENVTAGYINYNRSFKKFSIQAGVRAEQTNSEGVLNAKSKLTMNDTTEIVKRSYLDFFPSAAVSYTVSANHQFNINYSRRIDRPRYQKLNPFENKLDELTYEKGNAFLRPQYTNSFSLSHTYKSFLTTSLSYSHISDYIAPINDTARTNSTFITEKNLATQDVYNINVSAPVKVSKRWNIFANGTLSHSKYKANFDDGKTINLSVTTFNYYNQHTFTLGKGYTAEVSGWLNTPSIWGGTFETKFMWAADAGIQKTLLNNKATVKLAVTDLFKTNHWSAVSKFAGITFNGAGGYDSRQLRLTFQYRFGSNHVKAARERKTSIESESNRL